MKHSTVGTHIKDRRSRRVVDPLEGGRAGTLYHAGQGVPINTLFAIPPRVTLHAEHYKKPNHSEANRTCHGRTNYHPCI